MRITIAERLHPFIHTPGQLFPLPGSTLLVQVFPTRLCIYDALGSKPRLYAEIINDLKGPFEDFTAMLDLEKGLIRVWGHSAKGYVRYRIEATTISKQLLLTMEKTVEEKVLWNCLSQDCWLLEGTSSNQLILSEKSVLDSAVTSLYKPHGIEKLSLGINKAQDWELVHKRQDLTEIFPYWFRLGQLIKPTQTYPLEGSALLLNCCREAIERGERELILKEFLNLYRAGFNGVLAPALEDFRYQGFDLPAVNGDSPLSSLVLLDQGAKLIRSLFLQQHKAALHILPALPPEFHCGRLLDVVCGSLGKLSMEWTKKKMRRMTFLASANVEMQFCFPKIIKRFRLRRGEKGRSETILANSSINVLQEESYFLDNFEQ